MMTLNNDILNQRNTYETALWEPADQPYLILITHIMKQLRPDVKKMKPHE